MTREEYAAFYEETAPFHMSRATDLNKKCARAILDNIAGESALDVGCGRGFLVRAVRDEGRCGNIYGMDIVIPDELREQRGINFINGSAESIPFASSSVDTVICSHVLEHVVDLRTVISELRRVARRRVIIVVPSQRPYRYTFDLHLRFFPYIHSFLLEMMPFNAASIRCEYMDGDIYYQEDK
jgi:ubiquinone/menaquinone biosynthesis C-methylase UbiE